jgi:sulfur-oxidizing protein SoxY
MNAENRSPRAISRRRLLQSVAALAASGVLPATSQDLPAIPALAAFLAGRVPRWERLKLELPSLADNGQSVPMKLTMPGAFSSASTPREIHLFSEVNPVPEMAVFEFPSPPARVEIDSRVRLAGAQRLVAVAVMSDGVIYAASAEVLVTIAGCLDQS